MRVPATALSDLLFVDQKFDQESTKKQPNIDQNQRWSEKCLALRPGSCLGGVLEASRARLKSQHSPKFAPQIEGQSIEDRCKNRSKMDAFQVTILLHF